MSVKQINQQYFNQEIEGQTGVTVLKFGADWCGPCKAIAPTIEELASEYAGKAKVYEVNVDQDPELSVKFGIKGIPAVFLLKDGKPVKSFIGMQPKSIISEGIDSLVN